MIAMKDIADDNSAISSTRWAFAAVVRADIALVSLTLLAGIFGHFYGNPLDKGLFDYVLKAVGTLTGILTLAKAAQGFEPRKK